MKKTIILLFILVSLSIFAKEIAQSYQQMTILELSKMADIPTKKLKTILGIELVIPNHTIITKLGISDVDIQSTIKKFESIKSNYYLSIVMVGMIIVFVSLILIGFIIGQMKILQKFENRKREVQSPIGKISAQKNISQNDIVAVITAIFLHEKEAEEQDKMILTLKRQSQEMWSVANIIDMPNRNFFKQRNK